MRRWWACVAMVASASLAGPADDLLAQARRYAGEQSWHLAARDYGAFAERYPADPRAAQAGLDQLGALSRLPGEDAAQRYDTALADYVRRWRDTVWELRARRADASPGYDRESLRSLHGHADRAAEVVRRAREVLVRRAGDAQVAEELALALLAGAPRAGVQQRPWLLEAANLTRSLETRAQAWMALGTLTAGRDEYRSTPAQRAEAAGWWLKIVREAGQSSVAGEAWAELARRAKDHDDETALARWYEALRRAGDDEARQHAMDGIREIVDTDLSLYTRGSVAAIGQPARCTLYGRNVVDVAVTVWRADNAALRAGADQTRWQAVGTHRVAIPRHAPLARWRQELTLPLPGPGRYSLQVTGRPDPATARVRETAPSLRYRHVDRMPSAPKPPDGPPDGAPRWGYDSFTSTDLALLMLHDERELTAMVCDRRTRRSLAGIELVLVQRTEKQQARVVRGVTDADGLWRQPLTLGAGRNDFDLTAWRGEDSIQAADTASQYDRPTPDQSSREPATQALVWTDRERYRPGDTVHFAALVRRSRPTMALVAGQTLPVRLVGPRDEVLLDTKLTTDQAGILHGEWTAPADATLGWHDLRVGEDRESEARFELEEYRLPELLAELRLPTEPVQPGSRVTATLRATLPSGLPAAGAKVRLEGRWSSRRPLLDPACQTAQWRQSRWHEQRDGHDEDETAPQDARSPELTTDRGGEATWSFEVPAKLTEATCAVTAEITDLSHRRQGAKGSLRVSTGRGALWVATDRAAYQPGQTVTVACRAQDTADRPRADQVTATLYRLRWREGLTDVRDWRMLPSFERGEPVWSGRAVAIGPSGDAVFSFPAPGNGCYQVFCDGPRAGAGATFYCADATADHPWPVADPVVVPDRVAYAPGDTARLLVMNPARGMTLVLGRADGRRRLPDLVRHFEGNQGWIELPVGDAPGLLLHVWHASVGRDYRRLPLTVVTPRQPLRVTLSSDAAEYRTGQAGRLTVQTTDDAGQPVPARLLVAVTDSRAETGLAAPAWWLQAAGPDDSEHKLLPIGTVGGGDRNRPFWDDYVDGIVAHRLLPPEQVGAGDLSMEEAWAAAMATAGQTMRVGGLPAEVARSRFRETLLWAPEVVTGADGRAELPLAFPDSLTTWCATAVGLRGPVSLGLGQTSFRTRRDLEVRLIAPPLLIQGDEPLIAALPAAAAPDGVEPAGPPAEVRLTADGGEWLTYPAGQVALDGEAARFEGRLRADRPGPLALTASVARGELSDAMRLTIPVQSRGVAQFDRRAAVGTGRPAEAEVTFGAHQPGSATLRVSVGASRVGALLDALRWLPTRHGDEPLDGWTATADTFCQVLAARVAEYAGVAPDSIRKRPATGDPLVGTDEPRFNLRAPRNRDGGFSWLPDQPSDPELSAFAGEALVPLLAAKLTADSADGLWPLVQVRVPEDGGGGGSGRDERGGLTAWLERWLRRTGDTSDTAALATWVVDQVLASRLYTPDPAEDAIVRESVERLWTARARLGDAGLARLALTLDRRRDPRADVARRNLTARVVTGPDTASWGWQGDPVTATAVALQALLPHDVPVCDSAAQWLLLNRRGSLWHNPVATARAVAALADWSQRRREAVGPARLSLTLDGRPLKTWDVPAEQVLRFGDTVTVSDLATGAHRLALTREGDGSAYLSADLSWLSEGQPVPAASHRLTASREYALVDGDRRTALEPGQAVPVGSLLDCTVTLRAEVLLDWVKVAVPTPAGLRALDRESGWTSDGLWCYRQVRERGLELWVDHLEQGTSTLRYRLRAESAGRYQALPARVEATLLPGVEGMSDARWLVISP